MHYNNDPVASHSSITDIAESYKVKQNLQRRAHSGIIVLATVGWLISECGVHDHCFITAENRLISRATFCCHTINFHVADATFTKHAPQKVY
jgi:hypothetical protein